MILSLRKLLVPLVVVPLLVVVCCCCWCWESDLEGPGDLPENYKARKGLNLDLGLCLNYLSCEGNQMLLVVSDMQDI